MFRIFKHPSAYLPLTMSLAALSLVAIVVARYGVVRETDEGTAAHLFQLLMVLQVPIIAFFAVKWLPQTPRDAAVVLALQLAAAGSALLTIFLLEL
jgi:hypothetical protein